MGRELRKRPTSCCYPSPCFEFKDLDRYCDGHIRQRDAIYNLQPDDQLGLLCKRVSDAEAIAQLESA